MKKYLLFILCLLCGLLSFRTPYEKTFITEWGVIPLELKNQCYSESKSYKTSLLNTIKYGKIQKPVFLFEETGEIFDKFGNPIENIHSEDCKDLIDINCIDNLLLYRSYLKLKEIPQSKIISMRLIDGRRWQVTILWNNVKKINIDFNEGIPNIHKLLEMNKKYDLFERFDWIDVRLHNKMLIPKKSSS